MWKIGGVIKGVFVALLSAVAIFYIYKTIDWEQQLRYIKPLFDIEIIKRWWSVYLFVFVIFVIVLLWLVGKMMLVHEEVLQEKKHPDCSGCSKKKLKYWDLFFIDRKGVVGGKPAFLCRKCAEKIKDLPHPSMVKALQWERRRNDKNADTVAFMREVLEYKKGEEQEKEKKKYRWSFLKIMIASIFACAIAGAIFAIHTSGGVTIKII